MKTTIYWTILHSRRAVHEFRFRAACWWLSQQVEFLKWRLRLEALMPPTQSNPPPTSVGQGSPYAVRTM
ncbi:MAG TPA: hypothetical protein VGQ08_17755 [Nitrospiraceae bacterium]|jgi:hypothetical protein|nr:hypothetical protein [Nitrospiraceae bacterium]